MKRLALLLLLVAAGSFRAPAQVKLPASLRLAGPLDDFRSQLGDDIFHFPYGRGTGYTPIHGWIEVEFSPPQGNIAKFRLHYRASGDDPFIPFDSGHFFRAKFVYVFDSIFQPTQGELDLSTGEIRNFEVHSIFQNLLFHKTARNNRFPFSSLGKTFTTLFVDIPGLAFPFPLPYSERPPERREARFVFDAGRNITGFEFRGLTFVPIGIVPNVALMPTYAFGRQGVTIFPGADGCLPNGPTPQDQCRTDARSPDGNTGGAEVYLNPTLDMLTGELQAVDGPQKVPPALATGPSAGATAATLADRMYVIGGFDGQRVSNRASVYDPSSNGWSAVADFPRGVSSACAAAAAGKLYVIGGRESADGPPLASVSVFDPSVRAWSSAAPVPIPVANAACASVDNRVYIFGGWTRMMDRTVVSDAVWLYDPASNQWAAASRIPTPLAGAASAVVGSDIYLINGSQDGQSATPRVLVFSPAAGSWRDAPPTTRALYGASAGYLNGRLFLAGGRLSVNGPMDLSGIHFLSQTMQFLVPTRGTAWFTAPDPFIPLADSAAAVVGERWYMVGGDTSVSGATVAATDAVQAYSARLGWLLSDTRPVYRMESVRVAAAPAVEPSQLSPGAQATILGWNLSSATRSAPPVRFNGRVFTTDLPEQLSGVQVTVDGEPAGILAVSPERVDFLVPFSTTPGRAVSVH